MGSQIRSLIALSLLMTLTVACGKKGKDEAQVAAARTARAAGHTTLPTQAFQGSSVGKIYTSATYAPQFEQAVKHFASATLNPQYIGSINYQTGVDLTGVIEFDAQGNVATTSRIFIEIKDSNVGMVAENGVIESIKAYMSLSTDPSQRSYVQGSDAVLYFKDDFGWVSLRGRFDSNWFSGRVDFQNYRIYQGASEAPRQGLMGDFYVSTCGFFRCQ